MLAKAKTAARETMEAISKQKNLVAANLFDFLDYAGNDRASSSVTDLNFLTRVLD